MIIPMRREDGSSPKLYESDGVDIVVKFMAFLLRGSRECTDMLPAPIEGGKLHLVGTSNGGATVLAAACQAPELVASLTLVTGFVPRPVRDVKALSPVPLIRLYAGADDELGHQDALERLKLQLDRVGIGAILRVLPGAGHMTIGQHVDMGQFWAELEAARQGGQRGFESPPKRRPPAADGKFSAGTRVEVRCGTAWLAATVVRVPTDDWSSDRSGDWRWAVQCDRDRQGVLLPCHSYDMRPLPREDLKEASVPQGPDEQQSPVRRQGSAAVSQGLRPPVGPAVLTAPVAKEWAPQLCPQVFPASAAGDVPTPRRVAPHLPMQRCSTTYAWNPSSRVGVAAVRPAGTPTLSSRLSPEAVAARRSCSALRRRATVGAGAFDALSRSQVVFSSSEPTAAGFFTSGVVRRSSGHVPLA